MAREASPRSVHMDELSWADAAKTGTLLRTAALAGPTIHTLLPPAELGKEVEEDVSDGRNAIPRCNIN